MIAAMGRYLHQPIDVSEDLEADRFFAYYDTIAPLLKGENPAR